MVKIEQGKTIFESNAQTLVNTVNCVGVMGKGLALEFKNRYPAMFDKYKSFCDKGIFKPGVLWIYKAEDGKWILNFPTKIDWRNPSEMEYIEEGLKKFVEIWKEKGVTSVAFPLLGCTNGGLDADEVIPLMVKYLEQCEGLDAIIYDDRKPIIEDKPKIDETNEFFGEEKPKEIISESKPLVDEPPVVISDEEIVKAIVQIQKDENEKSLPTSDEPEESEEQCVNKTQNEGPSEEEILLKHLVNEKKQMELEIDKALCEFVNKENTPETRKEVTRKIVNTINRRGFPMGSIFQI